MPRNASFVTWASNDWIDPYHIFSWTIMLFITVVVVGMIWAHRR